MHFVIGVLRGGGGLKGYEAIFTIERLEKNRKFSPSGLADILFNFTLNLFFCEDAAPSFKPVWQIGNGTAEVTLTKSKYVLN